MWSSFEIVCRLCVCVDSVYACRESNQVLVHLFNKWCICAGATKWNDRQNKNLVERVNVYDNTYSQTQQQKCRQVSVCVNKSLIYAHKINV